MKKIILSILTAAFILFAGVMALQIVASERVEVVEVKTLDNKGEVATTRLWIIDHEGKQYLRAGADSGWYLRMKANPNITMTRDGKEAQYHAVERKHLVGVVNVKMNEKYTWGDDVIGAMTGKEEAIPMELQRL